MAGRWQWVALAESLDLKGLVRALNERMLRLVQALPFPSRAALGTLGATRTVAWDTAPHQAATLGANCTLTFTGGTAGGRYTLELTQDATGSRLVTWPSAVKWPGSTAPTLTTTANRTDLFEFRCTGSVYYGNTFSLNNS